MGREPPFDFLSHIVRVMKTHPLYPLTFHPLYRDYVWGGETIAHCYNRANVPRRCAESWELSGLEGSASIVSNGPFEGLGLDVLTRTFGPELVGTKAPDPETFPLLIKILDAHDRLSVQVHPDAETAAALGGRPKHEMWYVLRAQGGAHLWAGVRPGADPSALREEDLVRWPTAEGDVFDILPGVAHAIGPGNLIYEVQQPSDTTYRISDWGRGRELHPEQARRALRPERAVGRSQAPESPRRDLLPRLTTPDFSFATLSLTRERFLHTTEQSFMALFCASGKATLEHDGPHPITLLPGDLALVPPAQGVTLHPLAPSQLLLSAL